MKKITGEELGTRVYQRGTIGLELSSQQMCVGVLGPKRFNGNGQRQKKKHLPGSLILGRGPSHRVSMKLD